MNPIDKEIIVIVTAILIVLSITGVYLVYRPHNQYRGFVGLGILNKNCKFGNYPSKIINNKSITLCIVINNLSDKPVYFMVKYKITDENHLPTSTTPSPNKTLGRIYGVVASHRDYFVKRNFTVTVSSKYIGRRIALVFELWIYDPLHGFTYTGIWDHLYIVVYKAYIS